MVTAQALLLALAVSNPGETVLLEFSAKWCGPCQTMEPTIRRLSTAGFPVRQIDVDQHPEVATRFRVTGVPCFVMLTDGREVDRVVGAASFARLRQMFETAKAANGGARDVRGQSPDGTRGSWTLFGGKKGQAALAPRDNGPPPVDTLHAAAMSTDGHGRTIQDALAATVRIKVDDGGGHSFGTGTIIDAHGEEALVITCGHIFRDSGGKGMITVELFDGRTPRGLPGFLISYDEDRDIGLVSFTPDQKVSPARVAPGSERVRRGEAVFSIGCDHGAAPSVRRSRITAVDKYLGPPNIEVAGQPVQGRSGGGLFTADGQLIGICNAADPADDEGIYASLATIHWELDRIGQRGIYLPPGKNLLASANPSAPPGSAVADSIPPKSTGLSPPTVRPVVQSTAHGDTELICIVRARSDPTGPSRVFILNQPSHELMERLAIESRGNPASGREASDPLPERALGVVRAQSADR